MIRGIDFPSASRFGERKEKKGERSRQEVVQVTTRKRLHNGEGRGGEGSRKRKAVADGGMYRENLGGNPSRLSRDRLENPEFSILPRSALKEA